MNTKLYMPKRSFLTFLVCAAFLMVLMGGIDKAESCYTSVVHMPGEEPCWDICEEQCEGVPNYQQCYDDCYARQIHTGIQSAIDAMEMDPSCFGGPDCSLAICPGTYIDNVEISYPFTGFTASGVEIVADDANKPALYIRTDTPIPAGFALRGATGSCTNYPGGGDCAGLLVYNAGVDISSFLIYDNAYGIKLIDSSGSSIDNNLIYDNDNGIQLINSSGTVIYHNNIININNVNNGIQADDDNPANNDWHHPTLLEGNYWSDYTGVDDGSGGRTAGDGIGDTDIPHPGPDYDNYPFLFSGWSCSNSPVRIAGTTPKYYSTLQEAYDGADIIGETIQSWATYFPENLKIDLDKSVTLKGGYDCGFISNTSKTRLIGNMSVTLGSITIGNFILEK